MIAYRPSHTQISDRANKPYNSKSVVHDKTRPHVWGNVIHCGNRGVTVLCEGRSEEHTSELQSH